MTWTVTQSSYVTMGHPTLVYRLSCEAGNSEGLSYLSVMWRLMAYNEARTGLEGHLNSPEIGYPQLLSPQSTTRLHQQCDSGLHVYTDGVTQDYMFTPMVWLRSGLHVHTNGVTQDYIFTPMVWLRTTCLYQQSCTSMLKVLTLEHFGFQARDNQLIPLN